MIGSDSVRAFAKSSLKHLFSAFVALASPACSIRTSGWARCAAAVADSDCPTRLSASVDLPLISKPTSTEWPSRAISPRWPARQRRADVLHAVKPAEAGRRRPAPQLGTAGLEPSACCSGPAPARPRAAGTGRAGPAARGLTRRCRCRPAGCAWSRSLPPSAIAATTNASQPRMAARRCRALQLPARAARFLRCIFVPPLRMDLTHAIPESHRGPRATIRPTGVCESGLTLRPGCG